MRAVEENHVSVTQMAGIHPMVALVVSTVDSMLFVETLVTVGTGWIVSIPVGAALAIATFLVQKGSYGDSLTTAAGKGILIGLITAIPTPLPAVFTISSGGLGYLHFRKQRKLAKKQRKGNIVQIEESKTSSLK